MAKIEQYEGMLQSLWREGYEQNIPIKKIREGIVGFGRPENWWIKSQVKILEEFGYISRLHGDIWKINPEKIFYDWDQDAYNHLRQQDRKEALPATSQDQTDEPETIPADEMTNEQLREKIRKLELGVQAQEEMGKLTQLERDVVAEQEKNDAIEEVWEKVREELEYEIRKEIRIHVGEELDRRLGKPEAYAEVEEEDNDKTVPALPE